MPKRVGRRRAAAANKRKKVRSNWVNGLPPPDRSAYMRDLKKSFWANLTPAERERTRKNMSEARANYWAGMTQKERRLRAKKMRAGLARYQALARELVRKAHADDEVESA